MAEFRDDVPMRYIKSLRDIDKNDFEKVSWSEYIESMISTGPFDINVRMAPTKAFIIGE